MENRILLYAKKHIEATAQEEGITVEVIGNDLCIVTRSGKSYQLSEIEIKYQAKEHLLSEIESLK